MSLPQTTRSLLGALTSLIRTGSSGPRPSMERREWRTAVARVSVHRSSHRVTRWAGTGIRKKPGNGRWPTARPTGISHRGKPPLATSGAVSDGNGLASRPAWRAGPVGSFRRGSETAVFAWLCGITDNGGHTTAIGTYPKPPLERCVATSKIGSTPKTTGE